MSDTVLCEISRNGIATVTLNRPEVRNAINEIMVAELTAVFAALGQNPAIRLLVLAASGQCFCAGSDLNWMHKGASSDPDRNFDDALQLARLLRILDRLPFPSIARVHGPAIGVGLGLMACCDLSICTDDAWFAIPETSLGLIPAVISPYIIGRIGGAQARRFFLTAEKFNAATACNIGLVHEYCSGSEAMEAQIDRWKFSILQNSPHALSLAKRLIAAVEYRPVDDAMVSDTAHRIAHIRTHEEAQEGICAYLEQRSPYWSK